MSKPPSLPSARRRRALLACAIAAGMTAYTPVARATVPTIDPANLIQTAKSAVAAARQVQQLVQLGQQMYSMGRSIGQGGPMQMVSMGISTVTQLGSVSPTFQHLLGGATAGLGGIMSHMTGSDAAAIAMPSLGADTFTNPTSAMAFIQQAFFTNSPNLTSAALDGLRQRREMNARQTAVNAYGMAAHARNQISQAPQIQNLLVQENNATGDMRSDIKANTAVTLQLLDRLTHIQALLAADVELSASQAIAADRASGRN